MTLPPSNDDQPSDHHAEDAQALDVLADPLAGLPRPLTNRRQARRAPEVSARTWRTSQRPSGDGLRPDPHGVAGRAGNPGAERDQDGGRAASSAGPA